MKAHIVKVRSTCGTIIKEKPTAAHEFLALCYLSVFIKPLRSKNWSAPVILNDQPYRFLIFVKVAKYRAQRAL